MDFASAERIPNAPWPKKSCSLNCLLSAINCFEDTFQRQSLWPKVFWKSHFPFPASESSHHHQNQKKNKLGEKITCSKDVIIELQHLDEGAVEEELGVGDRICPIFPHPEKYFHIMKVYFHILKKNISTSWKIIITWWKNIFTLWKKFHILEKYFHIMKEYFHIVKKYFHIL